jgi:hypothetical protein
MPRVVRLPALLQQRVAGMVYCYSAWDKWHNKTVTQLREEIDRLVKAKGQAQEKAGKTAKDTAQQDQEKRQKMDQVGTCGKGICHPLAFGTIQTVLVGATALD